MSPWKEGWASALLWDCAFLVKFALCLWWCVCLWVCVSVGGCLHANDSVYLRGSTKCWFETFIYGSKITTTTGFPNSSFMSHTNHFLFVVRTCKISSLSKLQVHNTVLISSGTLIKGSIFTGVNRVKGISKGYLNSWGQPWVGSCYHLQPNEGA